MAPGNETVIIAGSATFTNASAKDFATVIAHQAVGSPFFTAKKAKAASNNLASGGIAVLTDERLVFGKGKNLKKISAGQTVDFADAIANDEVQIDVELADILSVSEGKQGLSKTLDIVTGVGTLRFAFMKKAMLGEWMAALNEAIVQQGS
ncbi:MAG: hypothetical protein FWE87_01010 [Coriobacteriia bacterium]|nr:hypothetical protein [Coriobacteriia bacterium]